MPFQGSRRLVHKCNTKSFKKETHVTPCRVQICSKSEKEAKTTAKLFRRDLHRVLVFIFSTAGRLRYM